MAITTKTLKRNLGFFHSLFGRLGLHRYEDHRSAQGRRWDFESLVKWLLVGLLCGNQGLGEIEQLSAHSSASFCKKLGLGSRRISDTTLRRFTCGMPWSIARNILRSVAYGALRSKQLAVDSRYPYGVVAMDGKYSSLPIWWTQGESEEENEESSLKDGALCFVQRTLPEHGPMYGKLRTINSVLSNTVNGARACLDSMPIPYPVSYTHLTLPTILLV